MKKLITILFTLIFCFASLVTVFASTDRELPLLVDKAGLLSGSEEKALNSKLEMISKEQKCEVAIVTVDSLNGKTATEYADDFYDYNGYGYGSNDDGILLLISMGEREWATSTYGYGIDAFPDVALDYLSERVLSHLSDGDFERAFTTFADDCEYILKRARSGKSFSRRSALDSASTRAFISLGIGLVIALIATGVMKSKLKSVRFQPAATSYVRQGSFNLSLSRDLYLYSRVDRRAKPQDTSRSSGGSSTHRSSSGRSHGGSSGRF